MGVHMASVGLNAAASQVVGSLCIPLGNAMLPLQPAGCSTRYRSSDAFQRVPCPDPAHREHTLETELVHCTAPRRAVGRDTCLWKRSALLPLHTLPNSHARELFRQIARSDFSFF
jgi:hypothetical protein